MSIRTYRANPESLGTLGLGKSAPGPVGTHNSVEKALFWVEGPSRSSTANTIQ